MNESERIQLTFEAGPGIRLDSAARALLKRAWRTHGLRCVRAQFVGGEACRRNQEAMHEQAERGG